MKSVIGLILYRLGRYLMKNGAKLMLGVKVSKVERIRPNIVLEGHSR